jgi:hypothetical protein
MKRGRRAVSSPVSLAVLARLVVLGLMAFTALIAAPFPAAGQAPPAPVAEGPELLVGAFSLAADLFPNGDLVIATAGGVFDLQSCFRRFAPCAGVPPSVGVSGRFGPAVYPLSAGPEVAREPRIVSELTVVAGAAGESLAVWQDGAYTNIRFNQTTGGLGLAGQRFDAAGERLGPAFKINVTALGNPLEPAASHDPRGGFVVVWVKPGLPAGQSDVVARRLAEDGTPEGPELAVAASSDSESLPAVAHGPDGSFLVVWLAFDQSGGSSPWELLARRYDPEGTPGEVVRIDLGSGFPGPGPVVRAAPGGGFVAGWSRSGPTSTTVNFWAARLDDAGHPLGAALPLNLRPVQSSSPPRRLDLAPDEAGGFLASWDNTPPRGGLSAAGGQAITGIYATYYDGQDQALIREVRLDTVRGYTNALLRAGSDGRRGYAVVWRRLLGFDQHGFPFGETYVRRFNLPGGTCAAGPETLCLADGRFQLEARFRNQHGGGVAGIGKAESFSGETGLFSFFAPGHVDLLVKVIDGRAVNGNFWLFDGSLTDVEYWLRALDTHTGRAVLRHNPPNTLCGKADIGAFPDPESPAAASAGLAAGEPLATASPAAEAVELFSALAAPLQSGACSPDAETLCLLDGRFAVRVQWQTGRGSGVGRAIPGTDATGFFWFFAPGNLELAVKLIDGRALTGKFWVFYGALTDVGYLLTVTDTATGATRSYRNSPGNFCGRGDTTAL